MYCRNYTGTVRRVLFGEVYCTVSLFGRVHKWLDMYWFCSCSVCVFVGREELVGSKTTLVGSRITLVGSRTTLEKFDSYYVK